MENEIRAEFFRRTLRQSFDDILCQQRTIASDFRADRLGNLLSSVQPVVEASGAHLQVEINYPLAIRFMDMRHLQNLRIYNRPLWQSVYRDVVPELRHGFTEEVKRDIRSQLQGLFPGQNN